MSLTELYVKGAKVWIPDPENVWKIAVLLENFDGKNEIYILSEDSKETKVSLKSEADLPPLKNPDILLGQNDLTSLSYLHEPAVLNNLRVRFCERNLIYTYCGIVLVAFNPYQSLQIYSNDIIRLYSGQDMSNMDPHIFAIGEEAYKRMSRFDENQSIIVSGESGAGKTVSAKYVMRYFATVCGSNNETQIEKRVLATNPIMEAIGNAKTTRNDNSSRFGKFIEIGFGKKHQILGANMRTYLLEKSRVVFQTNEERNYHIFYQLCSNADDPDFKILQLDCASEFHYTNQGNQTIVKSINDAEDFYNFVQALTMLGISQSKQFEIFRILSGILHLGNIKFVNAADNETSKITNDKSTIIMSKLFGINEEQIKYWLCSKQIVSANETLTLPLTIEQSIVSRDALAKHIYSGLFLWIVKQINKSLSSSVQQTQFIGVLDIYGFETFEVNSFEQFCINYANEKLQQQFCLHVFKLEQEEYMREGINWSFIDFHDNQPCIDLIEGRLGIIDLLDEECKMVKGSDQNWCNKLYEKLGRSKHFSKPRMSRSAFIIHHFADDVEYQINGFLEKNRDKVLDEHINIFKASEYELIAELFQSEDKSAQSKSIVQSSKKPMKSLQHAKQQSKTVGLQFSESLNLLMETLVATTPHYVRCIKPNDFKQPFNFDPNRTVQQLRACGVLETIRISSAGYPSRWTYPDFFKRYRILIKSNNLVKNANKENSIKIVTTIINNENKYQFGHTKLFLRSGLVAYLEKLRSDRLRACSILMQKTIKGWLCRCRYKKIIKLVHYLQNHGRGVIARKHARFLLMTKSATIIRAQWLAFKARTTFIKYKRSIIYLQTICKGYLGKTQFMELHKRNKIEIIQKFIRSWLARKHFKKAIRKIVIIQSLFRKRKARKLFRVLKAEAKSVQHISNIAKGLENKIFELQYKLNEKNKEISSLKEDHEQVAELKTEIQNLRTAAKSSSGLAQQVQEYEDIIADLKEQLKNEITEKNKFIMERDNYKKEKDQINLTLSEEIKNLQNSLLMMQPLAEMKDTEKEGLMHQRSNATNESLLKEIEVERMHHQKLIKDYSRLQQRFENLQHEIQMKSPQMGHRRSPSNISTISLESHSSGEKNDQDQGYGSVTKYKNKNGEIVTSALENLIVEKKELGILVRLQTKIRDLEKQNSRYRFELDRRDYRFQEMFKGLGDDKIINIFEAFKIQDLEMENHSIKNQLARLQKVMADSSGKFDGESNLKQRMEARQLIDQLEALKEQLKHKQNECIRFKTLFTHMELSSTQKSNINLNMPLNEDGELTMAYESQKKLNTILETELQRLQEITILRDQDLHAQIDRLIEENKKQQRCIEQNIYSSVDATLESTIQNEISRIANENLILHEEINALQDSIKKLKKALIIYAKRLKSSDVSDAKAELEREIAEEGSMPAVKYYSEREYNGMLEYRKEDEKILINKLIFELRPEHLLKQQPGLPSIIIVMCMRHSDYMNDDEKVRSFLTEIINAIKKVIKMHQNESALLSVWLSNTVSLLNYLRQYSGEKAYAGNNTTKQNEHCFKNFDLSEYRQILNDLAVWIFQNLVKCIESRLTHMIVPAFLENESIASGGGNKQQGIRQSANKHYQEENNGQMTTAVITKLFTDLSNDLSGHYVENSIIKSVFRQLFYIICSQSLNNLLLRKDLCNWMKGIQIRFNISQLEQWASEHGINDEETMEALHPLIQAAQLLQARKTIADIDSICEMGSTLSSTQIIKILQLYTPVNDYEEQISYEFILKIQEKLSSSMEGMLLMDTKFQYPISFPFIYSQINLDLVDMPKEWSLDMLKRI